MLTRSYGVSFFLKTPEKKTNKSTKYVYLRVTVDGIPKEISTKQKWYSSRWDQKTGRATGTREDAKVLNFFLDTLVLKITKYITDLINEDSTILVL